MTILFSAIVRELANAGMSPDDIVSALERIEAKHAEARRKEEEAILARPSAGAVRQRRYRVKQAENEASLVTPGASHNVTHPPDKECPQTPIETTPLVSSLRSETGSQSARAPESGCRVEFSMLFWPAYPHRVGRPAAMKSFLAARQRASLNQIMDGLARYRSSKPPDRQWLNPATFLNQDRFNDEPASTQVERAGRPKPANDAIREALLREAEDELGQSRFGPGPDGRNDDFSAGPQGHSGQHFLLEATANRRPD